MAAAPPYDSRTFPQRHGRERGLRLWVAMRRRCWLCGCSRGIIRCIDSITIRTGLKRLPSPALRFLLGRVVAQLGPAASHAETAGLLAVAFCLPLFAAVTRVADARFDKRGLRVVHANSGGWMGGWMRVFWLDNSSLTNQSGE
jgi:hypothetical protein